MITTRCALTRARGKRRTMKITHYDWTFDAITFAEDCRNAIAGLGITYAQADALLEYKHGYAWRVCNLKAGEYIGMGRFIILCNLLELDPRKYWSI